MSNSKSIVPQQADPVQENLLLACKCALKWLKGEYALLDDQWVMGKLKAAIAAAEQPPIAQGGIDGKA
jgi:hypothetical protein